MKCKVLAHVYLFISVFDSIGFSFLSLKKSIIHVLSEIMTKMQSIRIVLSLFQNAPILIFYFVLNIIKSNFKTI